MWEKGKCDWGMIRWLHEYPIVGKWWGVYVLLEDEGTYEFHSRGSWIPHSCDERSVEWDAERGCARARGISVGDEEWKNWDFSRINGPTESLWGFFPSRISWAGNDQRYSNRILVGPDSGMLYTSRWSAELCSWTAILAGRRRRWGKWVGCRRWLAILP